MEVMDQVRRLSVLPSRFNIMLERGLSAVSDPDERKELCVVACVVSNAAWQYWLAWRSPEDNRQEHEWVVFANIMRIAESEGLDRTEKRIATAFAFTHDSFPIPRIMEQDIRVAAGEQRDLLRARRNLQRKKHMQGGAKNARFLLTRLRHPEKRDRLLLTREEVKRCVQIVARHDSWKLDPPEPPLTEDRLAVVCLEGDALWPLHPIGVLADLERPRNGGASENLFDPSRWRAQLEQSHLTLVESRRRWKIPDRDFNDKTTIFRTKEGYRLYSQWRDFWNLRVPDC